MNRRDLNIFLGLEIFAIVWAGAVFSLLESRLIAGFLAGGYFVASGMWMKWRAWHWPEKWASPTWYAVLVHLYLVALPMLVTRMLQLDASFSDVRIYGLPGPVFHKISTIVFSVLITATVIDRIRVWWGSRTPRTTT